MSKACNVTDTIASQTLVIYLGEMDVKSGYLGVLTDELRRRGIFWGIGKLAKYIALRGATLSNRTWFGPFVTELSLTYRCRCACSMCGLPARHQADRTPMGLQDFKKLIDTLAGMGSEVISLGGGEPLLFEGLDQLVAAISRRGLACKLNTSGGPLTESRAAGLVRAGLSAVAVSLDGATPKTHDALRGRPGTFEQACQAVVMFARARKTTGRRLRISTCSMLSDQNLGEASAICRLVESWPVDHIGFMPVQRSAGVEQRPPDPGRLRRELVKLARDPLVDLSKAYLRILTNASHPGRCGAGQLSCVVDCYGDKNKAFPEVAEGRL